MVMLPLVPYYRDGRVALYRGDCTEVLKRLTGGTVDLAFADPPFNIGYEYDAYNDVRSEDDYLSWCGVWASGIRRVLKPTGQLWVAIGSRYQAQVKEVLRCYLDWVQTVVWHYTFGPRQESKFTPSWVALHHFVADPRRYTWNPDAVRVPSQRQRKYRDARAKEGGKLPNDVWVLDPKEYEGCFQDHQDAWVASRVCGTFKERIKGEGAHPCQMPEAILERVIRVSSNAGDLVLDPFSGSGTTVAVAKRLGRLGVGVELSEAYIAGSANRVRGVQVSRG
jgi:DNA modification methylase